MSNKKITYIFEYVMKYNEILQIIAREQGSSGNP